MPRKPKSLELNEREKLADSFVRCFESAEGKAVLAYLKATYQDRSGVHYLSVTGALDHYWIMVHVGCRQVYLDIKSIIEEGLNARSGRNTGDDVTVEPPVWDL